VIIALLSPLPEIITDGLTIEVSGAVNCHTASRTLCIKNQGVEEGLNFACSLWPVNEQEKLV
jgi:hypothetical protein